MTIAEVAFDAPLPHPFSYRVPEGWPVSRGQRVAAPLRGAVRVGVVVSVREGDGADLKPLHHCVDPAPLLGAGELALAGWIAAESLTPLGSTCLALLPPAPVGGRPVAGSRSVSRSGSPGEHPSADRPGAASYGVADRTAPAAGRVPVRAVPGTPPVLPEVLVGAGREARLLDAIAREGSSALVLTADVDGAGRWAQRLARLGTCVRLDSGVTEVERAAAWASLAAGDARLAVGTRSALLVPLPPGGTLALVDEHEAAHKPPGPPRVHARDVVLERVARGGVHALMTSATPSVETWWRVSDGRIAMAELPAAPWPAVTLADTRGIARREALTPPLARAIRETLATGRRVFLAVSRLASALGCDECGGILKCEQCGIALAYSPAGRTLACRFCAAAAPLPETCPACRGRRLAPFGWGAERVEHAVRRRFAQARIARYDPDAARGRRAEAQRAAAAAAAVVIGTRGALRLFGPASLGLAAFVSPDQLLGLPDFRAAERAFALAWAAAERVRPDGAVVIQTQNPSHYAFAAVAKQDLESFYAPELRFRAELGYPPFRRLAIITAGGADAAAAQRRADDVVGALSGGGLTVYPPAPDRRNRARRVVVKGGPELPRALEDGLRGLRAPRAGARRGIMDVEVDPVEWPS
ncbi:MAG TPA: primosomal protein N' [Methylomirabilota bacterium]|nr:primosomal protein N' [Methylomirabilota bacterium]